MRNSNSSEDYLKCILVLKEKKGQVRSIDVARELGVTKPSVSNAMKKLRKENMLTFEEIHDKHLLITKVLMRIGVSEQTALKEACMIEHVISEETYKCLRDFHSGNNPKAG